MRAQFIFAAGGNGGDLHQVFDVFLLIRLHPDMFVGVARDPGVRMNVRRHFGHAMHKRMGDEPDLFQIIGHRDNVTDRLQIHIAIAGIARVNIAMPASARTQNKPTIAARQVQVTGAGFPCQSFRHPCSQGHMTNYENRCASQKHAGFR